jgi:pilus assembly protein CpaB
VRPAPPTSRLPLPGRLPLALALRRRPRLRRLLVLGLAALVGTVVATTVQRADAARAAWGRSRPVVVAVRDLPPGHVLDDGDTEVVAMPAPVVPDGALARVAPGRVVRAGVFEGEVLSRRRLSAPGVEGAAALVPAGARAVAVPVEAGSAPALAVGQRVDVVGLVAVDGVPEAAVLVAGAPVVEVGELAVTLAVAPEAVPRVAAALASGTVTLALVGQG